MAGTAAAVVVAEGAMVVMAAAATAYVAICCIFVTRAPESMSALTLAPWKSLSAIPSEHPVLIRYKRRSRCSADEERLQALLPGAR